MVSILALSAVDRGFEPQLGQTKAKHMTLRSKSKDWSARNQNNVSEWSDMHTRGLLFPTQRVGLEQSRSDHHHLIEN